MYIKKSFLLLAVIVSQNPIVQCAKILVILPFSSPAVYICVQPYLKALAARGHQLTVVSSFPQRKPVANFTDIKLNNNLRVYEGAVLQLMKEFGEWHLVHFFIEYGNAATVNVLQNKEVQKLLHSSAKFDLVIVETMVEEALYALAHHFEAHLIGISIIAVGKITDELIGNVSPVSYVPYEFVGYNYHMNFLRRLANLWHTTFEYMHYHYVYMPQQIAIYHKYVPNATVDLRVYRKKFALLLLYQHFSISFPRPYVPNAIEVAGMHIQHVPKKLPANMEAFINASAQGAIYFSLGFNIKSNSLPVEQREILLQTFASLPVNVLWKYEDTELPGKPANVFISKWFPQSDILAHPKVRLFITQGGLISITEAIHHAKPVVCMVGYYDQYINIKIAQMAGFGVSVHLRNLTAEDLRGAIMQVLQNSTYTENAKLISRRYHDQPMKPLDKAIYWTEYVLRHDGAPHMRVAAQELNFIQVHSLDTIAVLFGGAALVLVLVLWLLVRLLCAIFGLGKARQVEQKLKQR